MGKKLGRNLSGMVVAEEVEFVGLVGEAEAEAVVLGFAFTGRSG